MTAPEFVRAHYLTKWTGIDYETCQNLAAADHLEQQDPAPQQDDQPAAA